jgi:glycerophosphoryl diester phosphodiesterase
VAETRDAVLRAVDAGRRFGAPFAGEPLPTLREAMMRCLALGLSANVEIKAEPGQEEACGQAVARIARRTWEGPPPLLSSFSPVALAAAREAAPELPRALLVGRAWVASPFTAQRAGSRPLASPPSGGRASQSPATP